MRVGARKSVPVTPDDRGITCHVYTHGRPADSPHDLADISEILEVPGCLVWFDVVDPGPDGLALLQEEFDLHPLAVEDAIGEHQRPKIEAYPNYWFLIVVGTTIESTNGVQRSTFNVQRGDDNDGASGEPLDREGFVRRARGESSSGGRIVFHEMAVFAGKNFLVTVRHSPAYPMDEIVARWQTHPEGIERGGGYLLYVILDTIVDGFLPVAETLQDRVDALEEVLFDESTRSQDVLPDIFDMKKDVQRFRRAALPMREVLTPIIREDIPLFHNEALPYFRDVYDHTVLVLDQLDSVRDLVNSALEIHLSVVSNRQNEIAKQLTIIATIFLPLGFIVGFFGQNFGLLVKDIGSGWTFWALGLGTEALAVLIMLVYFKRKHWL